MSAHSDDDLLLIRCPSCGQRFNVEEGLRGKMVECGECDHQFEIQDPVILKGKKFYPGEKRDPLLAQISRVDKPLPKINDPEVPESFASQTNPVVIEPVSPQRIVMGAMAVFAILVTGLFLVLGATRGGALDGVSTENRMILAGFVTLLATALLVYANARAWLLMIVIGLSMGGGLVSLPLFFDEGSTALGAGEGRGDSDPDAPVVIEPGDPSDVMPLTAAQLRELIGTGPLEDEQLRLVEEGSTKSALGLWLRNLKVRNCLLVRDYVIRETGASFETHFYPRDKGSFLMVVTGIDVDLNGLAVVASALGKVKEIHEELDIVEVVVDNERFLSGPMSKLTDSTHPEFYLLNKIELDSIDLNRIESAVRRLSDVEPALFQSDINKRLVELLGSDWVEFKEAVCKALLVWAPADSEAGRVALQQALTLKKQRKEITEEMIALCIKLREYDVLPLLHELWQENPTRWEPWFREAGPPSERIIIQGFDACTGSLRQSACRILGQIGGENSLPILKDTASTTGDTETRIMANTAIQMIEKRLNAQKGR